MRCTHWSRRFAGMLLFAFWGCLALAAYAYLCYPVIIWLCARLFGAIEGPPGADNGELPAITLLIAAHNEETVIGKRLENALALDYPPGKLRVVVASDGSTDRTVEFSNLFADRGVEVFDYPTNRGKSATLNAAMRELSSDVVLLSDANTFVNRDAARLMARWFDRPEVGAVCGRLVLVNPRTGANVDSLYWRYETFLKQCEARLGALLGANGAIYAIRRELFVEIPPETIVDDFMIPLLAKIKTGCRLVYESEAVAREESPPNIGDEFRRRVRIGAGGFQSLVTLWPLLSPLCGWLAFSFWSHKVLRWFCPFFLVGAFAANLLLLDQAFYVGALAAQIAFYLLAWLGGKLPARESRLSRVLRLVAMFGGMNAALLLGFFRLLTGRQRGAWTRTARTAA